MTSYFLSSMISFSRASGGLHPVLSSPSLAFLSSSSLLLSSANHCFTKENATPSRLSIRRFTSTTTPTITEPEPKILSLPHDVTSNISSSTLAEPISINISYLWDRSPNVHSLIIQLHPDAKHINMDQLMALLVQDKQNISMVHNIKYYKESLAGYVNLPQEISLSKLNNNHLKLLLEREPTKPLVIGPRFSYDMNAGLIWDTLNPSIRSKFLGGGRLSRQRYLGDIKTIGLKIELAVRLQVAFLIRPPWASLFFHEPIELGSGLDLATPGFNITWASFKHSPGGLLCFGIPMGLTLGLSLVRGGSLIPVSDPENTPIPPRPIPVSEN